MAQKWIAPEFGSLDALTLVDVDVATPQADEVTIDVKAAGINPADIKAVTTGQDPKQLPVSIGYEVSGVISAVGDDTPFEIGDEVIAYRTSGGYATQLTIAASSVFAKPANLSFAEASNLFLAAATAADMLRVVPVASGDTVLVHGASGAVGVSLLQQLRSIGARAIGTASTTNFDLIDRFGGEPIEYGTGLEKRVTDAAPEGITAAFDTVGTDEAIDVSLALLDPARIVSIAAFQRASRGEGYLLVGGAQKESGEFRNEVRQHLVDLAAAGELEVVMGQTFPFADAIEAMKLVATGHPGGKVALIVSEP